jgi:hypothetical protein
VDIHVAAMQTTTVFRRRAAISFAYSGFSNRPFRFRFLSARMWRTWIRS